MRATSAAREIPSRAEASSSARQNSSSRAIEVRWPAMVKERFNNDMGAGLITGPSSDGALSALWRRFALVALAGCAFAGAALAQVSIAPQAPSSADPELVFSQVPRPRDLERRYPAEAWSEQRDGRALLCCMVLPDGALACAAVAESPEGWGFGEAARILSGRYRLTPESAEAWRTRGGIIRLPIYFRATYRPIPAPPIASEPQCGRQAR